MKSWCIIKISFRNCEQWLFDLFVESAQKVFVLWSGKVPNRSFYFWRMYSTSVNVCEQHSLNPDTFSLAYDMGMFPKLHSVWQQPLIEISTSWYAAAFQFFFSSFFKSFCTFHLCKSIYVLCICKPCTFLALIMKYFSHLFFCCWWWCFCLVF